MEFFVRLLLNQDKTFKLISKILFLILCSILSVWLAEKFGYELNVTTLNIDIILTLFTKYYLLLGITLFFITVESITIINTTMNALINQLFISITLEEKEITTKSKLAMPIMFMIRQIQKIKENPKEFPKAYYQEMTKNVNKEFGSISNFPLTVLAFIFSYILITREKFPNTYFPALAIVMFLLYFCLVIFNLLITELTSTYKSALKQLEIQESETVNQATKQIDAETKTQ